MIVIESASDPKLDADWVNVPSRLTPDLRKTVCPPSRGGSPYTAPAMVARVGRADPHRRRASRGGMSNRLRWN